MSSYIEEHIESLKKRHYIRKATVSTNYWFDFTDSVLLSYKKEYGNNFCLVIHGSIIDNNDYILPYQEVQSFFSEDFLDDRLRWIGYVKGNILRISARGKGKSMIISKFYNAFDLLHSESVVSDLLVKEPTSLQLEIDDIELDHLKEAIKFFNSKYESVVPVKRIVISEQIARPGLISDYLKNLLDYNCQICDVKGFHQRNNSLYAETHHIMELHELIRGSYCSDNIIVVCPTCHKKLHYAEVNYNIDLKNEIVITINGDKHNLRRNILTI